MAISHLSYQQKTIYTEMTIGNTQITPFDINVSLICKIRRFVKFADF